MFRERAASCAVAQASTHRQRVTLRAQLPPHGTQAPADRRSAQLCPVRRLSFSPVLHRAASSARRCRFRLRIRRRDTFAEPLRGLLGPTCSSGIDKKTRVNGSKPRVGDDWRSGCREDVHSGRAAFVKARLPTRHFSVLSHLRSAAHDHAPAVAMHPRYAAPRLAPRSLHGLAPRFGPHLHRNAPARPLNPSQARCMSMANTSTETLAGNPEPLAEAVLNLSWGLLEILHNCGLSWAVALPASAVVIRAFIIMPLFQIPSRKAQQTTASLLPLTRAYNIVKKHSSHMAHYSKGPRVAQAVTISSVARYNHQIRKRWGAQRWKQMLPFCGLPVFISMAEVIRRMVGARSGLWGLVFGSGSYAAPKASEQVSDGVTTDGVTDALEKVAEWKGTTSLPSSVPEKLSSWLEPSMAAEGMLWFPNLMLPDPYMILPWAVCGLTMASIYAGSKPPHKGHEKPSFFIFKRVLMTLALAIGPMTLNLPAGILLYWCASTSCAWLSHVYLDRFYPVRMPPTPCKRSIPYYPKKDIEKMRRQR